MIEPKLIIDYRERHPNLRALSDSGAVLGHQREILGIFPYFPVQAIAISHRRGPIFSALTLFTQNAGDWGRKFTSRCQKKLPNVVPKALVLPPHLVKSSTSIVTEMAFVVAAANSASNLTQYCQYILSQGNMSPPENESKVYREATLFRVNYERAAWRKHTRGNKEANPPRKSISQLGKHRKEGDYNIFHKDFQPSAIQSKSHRACHELWTNGNIIWESMENGARWSLQMLSMARSLQNTNALNGEYMRGGTHGPFARHWYSPAFSLYQRYRALATVKIMFFQNMYFSM